MLLALFAATALSCVRGRGDHMGNSDVRARSGQITSRPGQPVSDGAEGLQTIELRRRRDPLLYVPSGSDWRRPLPLIVSLHGAGGDARHGIDLLRDLADEHRLLLLAPASQDTTWDVIVSSFGTDVSVLNQALEWVFARHSISRIAISGFSDGASYALSLGLANGDLFSHVLAFSPGFYTVHRRSGQPGIFISHGTDDRVLPIDRCSRAIVPRLRKAGYKVRYEEFPGGHHAPDLLRREAVRMFLDG